MHEKNIALLCDEADRLLQLNINLLRQMVEEPDVLSDSKNENRLLFDKQKALKRIEELEGEQINLSALMEERTETVTRRRRQSGVWGTVCRWFGTSDLGWENYDEDVSRSVININKVREEVMSLTRAYFGELQASIEQDINQPVRQEIDAFFCAFREKVEQLRNTLIQSSEDHKRDQQAQERLTGRLQALNERVPELITDSKALREELETML
jgi:replication fork clamp-binding protein CrfC